MTNWKLATVAVLLLSLTACKVGPNYQRPPLDVPGQYRGLPPDADAQQPAPGASQQAAEDFAQMKWWTVFQDDTLQALIKDALANNYDLRIAATRIVEASANLGIVRANQFPTINGNFSIVNQQSTPLFTGSPTIDTAGLQLNYIVDFWGQYRRATEAARAILLSTYYGRDVVQTTLISLVAQNYFLLRQYDAQLKYSQQSVDADEGILKLNTIKYKGGDAAITDVYQAQVLVQQAQAEVISLQQAVAQTENNISLLLGKNPQDIPRGLSLTDQAHLPMVPAGLPSALLQRRPDILRDEQSLVAANANVGVAKAAFFPQIALTGQFGAASTAISSFLAGPATFWAVGGQITQPIFQGGRIRSNYQSGVGAARRGRTRLQEHRAAGLRRRFQQPGRLHRFAPVPHEDRRADGNLQRNRAPGQRALSGRRHQLPGGAGDRAGLLQLGAATLAGVVPGDEQLRAALSGAGRRLGSRTPVGRVGQQGYASLCVQLVPSWFVIPTGASALLFSASSSRRADAEWRDLRFFAMVSAFRHGQTPDPSLRSG